MRFSTTFFGFCYSAATILFARGAMADSVARQVLAVTGQAAPGTADGVTFNSLTQPTLNSRGDVAFGAFLSGTRVNSYNNYGLWLAARSATAPPLTMAYRGADSTSYLNQLSTPSLNADDQLVFWTRSGTSDVLLTGTPGQYKPIVTTWDPAPGIGGGVLIDHRDVQESPRIYDSGDVIFDTGIFQKAYYSRNMSKFVLHAGVVEPIAYSGYPAPGAPGMKIANFNSAVRSGNGHIAFIADVDDANTRYGAWVGTPGALVRAAAGGQLVSIPSGDFPIDAFGPLAGVNDLGLGVFTAHVMTGSTRSPGGVFAFDARDGLHAVAVPGTPIPALGVGFVVNSAYGYEVNNRGEVIVSASVIGPDPAGQSLGSVLVWKDDTLRPVLTDNDSAPGIGPGIKVSTIAMLNLNSAGESLVTATLAGPGVDATNNSALWATDPLGHFQLIARTGNTQTINGVDRVVKQVNFSMPHLGDASVPAMNDAGQVAYQLKFTDGSVANMLATLPSVIAGDADNDLGVDIKDFDILVDHYGQPGTRVDGDFDYDGLVTFDDFQILRGNFGRAYDGTSVPVSDGDWATLDAFAQTVPEPCGALMSAVATAVAMAWRRSGHRRPRHRDRGNSGR